MCFQMGSKCAPHFADLFLFSYEANFIQSLLQRKEKKMAQSFGFTFSYIDDVISMNNSTFGDYVDRVYGMNLKTKIQQ